MIELTVFVVYVCDSLLVR